MKPVDDICKLIKKMQLKASNELDRKVHDDISRTLIEYRETESTITHPDIWISTVKSRVKEIAVAAVIIFAFCAGFSIGRWSKTTRPAPRSLDVAGYTSIAPTHPTAFKAEDSFWRQKALAALQPKPYAQTQNTKTNLIDAYKQYLKEKHYD